MSEELYKSLKAGSRVLKLLESTEEYGGPQSLRDVCRNLRIPNNNARSILSKMYTHGKIDRIKPAVYRAKGDNREYNPNKPHYKE